METQIQIEVEVQIEIKMEIQIEIEIEVNESFKRKKEGAEDIECIILSGKMEIRMLERKEGRCGRYRVQYVVLSGE